MAICYNFGIVSVKIEVNLLDKNVTTYTDDSRQNIGNIDVGSEEEENFMSRVARKQAVGQKKNGHQRKHHVNMRKMSKFILTVIVAFGFFVALFTVTVVANSTKIDSNNIYSYLSEASVLYDQDGHVIDNVFVGDGNRVNVKYEDLPKNLVNAVVAIEDKTFWTHHGFNVVRIFGAIWDSIRSGGSIGGTSTITQQLARNVYLVDTKNVRSLNRKISEAYYTILLESSLTKKQILEAYLNTIFLGNNCYGVQSASQAYFSKDVSKLSLLQCAALAAIPKAPDAYALIKRVEKNTASTATGAVKTDKNLILSQTSDYMLVYNGAASANRRNATLKFMQEQGYITQKQLDSTLAMDLKKAMNPPLDSTTGLSAYFCDYVISQVIQDLMSEYGYNETQAKDMLYKGGLKIYTTMDSNAQAAIEKAFDNSNNFPSVANLRKDSKGNLLNDKGKLLLYNYYNYFKDDVFTFNTSDFKMDSKGNMVILKGKRFNIYHTIVNGATDYSIEFKPMYIQTKGVFYSIESGAFSIPQQYKSLDSKGNVVIDASFFKDKPNFFIKSGSTFKVKRGNYTLKQQVRQPQAAMVITDYHTGQIKAMAGGRNTTGRQLFNRALSPQQPGSAIKPMSVYSSALQLGMNAAATGKPMKFGEYDKNQKTALYGSYLTAASIINDAPLTVEGRIWPKNWYSGYRGLMTLRKSVEQSVNVNAVRVFQQVGTKFAISQLKKFGITSVVTDTSSGVNDVNVAALALGGMSNGVSPLEMSSAFGTFPNQGKYIQPICYTKITNKKDEVLINKTSKNEQVIDKGVAFIMTDILKTTVSRGIAGGAATGNQPVGGKTGTTSDNFDAWFCGFTPQYSAALWIGNDVNIELSQGSPAAARLWGKIMHDVCAGMKGSFPGRPSDVIQSNVSGTNEYYINGTQEGVATLPKEVTIEVCTETGYKATPWCPDIKTITTTSDDVHAQYFCNQHNINPTKYPIDPTQKLNTDFVWVEPDPPVVVPPVVDPGNGGGNTGGKPGKGN
jgi:penicillin-binding protein 1A